MSMPKSFQRDGKGLISWLMALICIKTSQRAMHYPLSDAWLKLHSALSFLHSFIFIYFYLVIFFVVVPWLVIFVFSYPHFNELISFKNVLIADSATRANFPRQLKGDARAPIPKIVGYLTSFYRHLTQNHTLFKTFAKERYQDKVINRYPV